MLAAAFLSGIVIGGLLVVLPWWLALLIVFFGSLALFVTLIGEELLAAFEEPAKACAEEDGDPWASLPPKWHPPVETVVARSGQRLHGDAGRLRRAA